jgi:hypothetical protein
MFEPISRIAYHVLNLDKQLLVCTLSTPWRAEQVKKWGRRAAASFEFDTGSDVLDVIRDLLANPQIRAIVFDGTGPMRVGFDIFWETGRCNYGNIAPHHLTVVRQFVDLYDGDCDLREPLPPFWPERLRYETTTDPARTAPLR